MTCACHKRAYRTRALARAGIRSLKAGGQHLVNDRGRLHPYRCDGGLWHLGHAPLQLVVMYRRRAA